MTKVFIETDKAYYVAGETVNGYVYLDLYQNMNGSQVMVKFKGWESVRWFQERLLSQPEIDTLSSNLIYNSAFRLRMDSSDSEDHPGENQCAKYKYVKTGPNHIYEIIKYEGSRNVARFDHVLHNFGGSFIPAGQYSFPFSFKTGDNYPASFSDKSSKADRRGRIKYQMQAFVRGYNDRLLLLRTKQQIIIRQTAPIKNDQQEMQAHVTSCCCIDQGTTRIKCYFQKNGYMAGEDARIYCKLDNTEGKTEVTKVQVKLVNEITYTSSEGHKKTFTQKIFTKQFSGLGAGEQGQRENVVKIHNTSGGKGTHEIHPTAQGSRLHSVYFLVVDAQLAAACTCCSDLPIVRQPVLIYPPPAQNYLFSPPSQWSPKIMPAMNFQVGLPSLGVKVNPLNMNVNMGPPSVQISTNPYNNKNNNPYNSDHETTNVRMNVNMPVMEMQIQGPMMTTHLHGNGGYMAPMSPTSPHSPTKYGAKAGVAVGGVEVQVGGVSADVSVRPF